MLDKDEVIKALREDYEAAKHMEIILQRNNLILRHELHLLNRAVLRRNRTIKNLKTRLIDEASRTNENSG